MLQNILKLKGTHELSIMELKKYKGEMYTECYCPTTGIVVGFSNDCRPLLEQFCKLDF
jgi:hypothetical protein